MSIYIIENLYMVLRYTYKTYRVIPFRDGLNNQNQIHLFTLGSGGIYWEVFYNIYMLYDGGIIVDSM